MLANLPTPFKRTDETLFPWPDGRADAEGRYCQVEEWPHNVDYIEVLPLTTPLRCPSQKSNLCGENCTSVAATSLPPGQPRPLMMFSDRSKEANSRSRRPLSYRRPSCRRRYEESPQCRSHRGHQKSLPLLMGFLLARRGCIRDATGRLGDQCRHRGNSGWFDLRRQGSICATFARLDHRFLRDRVGQAKLR